MLFMVIACDHETATQNRTCRTFQSPLSRALGQSRAYPPAAYRNQEGQTVAKIVPTELRVSGDLLGSVKFHGDIVAPILDEWEVER